MPISGYLKLLREVVGNDLLLVPSACVFIRDAEGRILLQQRADNGEWVLPGGAMDPGESIVQAAVREIYEESGLNIKVTRLIGVYSDPANIFKYNNGDQIHAIVLLFEGEVVSGSLRLDGDETMQLVYFECDNLPKNLSKQQKMRISDALTESLKAFIR